MLFEQVQLYPALFPTEPYPQPLLYFYGGLEASKLSKLTLQPWIFPQGEGEDSFWSDEHLEPSSQLDLNHESSPCFHWRLILLHWRLTSVHLGREVTLEAWRLTLAMWRARP
jgi:hypothetical protein